MPPVPTRRRAAAWRRASTATSGSATSCPTPPAVPAALRQDVQFSTAVAGFAQLLRGGRYTGGLSFEDVLREAQASRGEDPYGYRAEFVQLVRRAMQARGIQ